MASDARVGGAPQPRRAVRTRATLPAREPPAWRRGAARSRAPRTTLLAAGTRAATRGSPSSTARGRRSPAICAAARRVARRRGRRWSCWQAVAGRPGVALLVLAALLPPLLVVAARRGPRLGSAGSPPRSRRCSASSASPARSPRSPGQASRWRDARCARRARLLVADARRAAARPAAVARRAAGHARRARRGRARSAAPRRTWSAPVLSLGVLLGARCCGRSRAVVLPWIVRGRSAAAATSSRRRCGRRCSSRPRRCSTAGLGAHAAHPSPRGARARRGPRRRSSPSLRARCAAPSDRGCVAWLPAAGRCAEIEQRRLRRLADEPAQERRDHDRQPRRGRLRTRCSAPRCARWSSRASSPARWTQHRTVSVSRVYVPNEYSVWLSPAGPRALRGRRARGDRRAVRLPARARPPRGSDPGLAAADRLSHRRAAVARRIRHPGAVGRARRAGTSEPTPATPRRRPQPAGGARRDDDLQHLRARCAGPSRRRRPVARHRARCSPSAGGACWCRPAGGTIGRSRDCDIVLDDAGVSRRHAEIRPGGGRLDDRRTSARPTACASTAQRSRGAQPLHAGRPRRARLDGDRLRSSDDHARARIGRAEVRLPRRPLPVPAVGRAQRPHATCAAAAPRARRPRRRDGAPIPPDATGCTRPPRSAAPTSPTARPRLVVERAPGHDPGMIYDLDGDIVLGRGDRAEIRLEDPFASSRHARVYEQGNIVVIEDLGSTNGTYLNEELLQTPAPAAPRRPRAHRRQRIRVRGRLRCCAWPSSTRAPTPGASGAPTRTRCSPARRCSWSPTAWAARRPARSPRGSPSSPSSRGLARRRRARGSRSPTLARAANARIHELSHANAEQAGMGTTLTAVYVGERGGRDRARRRQPRLLPARRRAAAPDRRPLARRRADAPGPAHARGSGRASAALGHHARARPRGDGRGRHALLPRPRRRRLPAVQRRPDDDGRRGAARRDAARAPATARRRRGADRGRQRGRRARQHHGRAAAPRGGAARGGAAGRGGRRRWSGSRLSPRPISRPAQRPARTPRSAPPRSARSPCRAAPAGACRGWRRRPRRGAAGARGCAARVRLPSRSSCSGCSARAPTWRCSRSTSSAPTAAGW